LGRGRRKSYSNYNETWEKYISGKGHSPANGARQFRCVRNLGSRAEHTDLIIRLPINEMNLSNVNSQALRPDKISSGELAQHTERDIYSHPYKKIPYCKGCGIDNSEDLAQLRIQRLTNMGTSLCSNYSEETNDRWKMAIA
jgi:hypothetical protein